MKNNMISVNTPRGQILAKVVQDGDNPGILLEFIGEVVEEDGNPGALMAYSPTVDAVRLHTYNRFDPDGDPVETLYMSEPRLSEIQEKILIQVLDDMTPNLLTLEDEEEHIYASEIFCDYDERLSDNQIYSISDTEDPGAKAIDIFTEWEADAGSYENFTFDNLYMDSDKKRVLEPVETAVNEWLEEHIVFRLPYERLYSQRFHVNVILATHGEANRDFGEYTCLNYYGKGDTGLDDDNALMWIAKQFGKDSELKEAISLAKEREPEDEPKLEDSFIRSCVLELEEFTHAMGAVTLLLNMTLSDFVKLAEMRKAGKGILAVDKEAMCGIFNPWNGGGSTLEIQLPSELKIPVDMIWSAWADGSKKHGYDVDEAYSLVGSCWKDCYRLED